MAAVDHEFSTVLWVGAAGASFHAGAGTGAALSNTGYRSGDGSGSTIFECMTISIRKATKADFPAVYALFQEFAVFQKTPEKLYITLDQLIADEQYFQCLVADVDGRIVGFASFFFAYYSWTGKGVY